jgi:hypothetical protein
LTLPSDYVPTILLDTWPLEANMWDGDVLAGPVPTVFAEVVEEAAANMEKNIARTHSDFSRFGRLLGVVEHVEMDKALALLRKPR